MSIRASVAATAATLCVAALPLVTAGTAEAYQCKATFAQAEAIGPNVATTVANAKAIWSNKVKNKYDLAWSVWNISVSKSQNCAWTGAQQYCVIKAKPCLYVVP